MQKLANTPARSLIIFLSILTTLEIYAVEITEIHKELLKNRTCETFKDGKNILCVFKLGKVLEFRTAIHGGGRLTVLYQSKESEYSVMSDRARCITIIHKENDPVAYISPNSGNVYIDPVTCEIADEKAASQIGTKIKNLKK